MLCEKKSGIVRGQTLRIARRKCIAKVVAACKTKTKKKRKNDFGDRSTLFRRCFTGSGLEVIHGKCKFLFEQP